MARPERDVFGQCINCGVNMLIDQYVDGRIQRRFTADKTEVTYLLDDGSRMRISTCKKCKEELDGSADELTRVMKAVILGWKHEVETYTDWDDDRKDKYINRYGQLKIVVRSDNKNDDVLEKTFRDHEKKHGKKKFVELKKKDGKKDKKKDSVKDKRSKKEKE